MAVNPLTAADIVADMIRTMAVADPELDTSIGTVSRKILDVVGEQIAPAYADRYLGDYIFDISTKSGADLDDFCAMFGIYRFAARRAIGVVTFRRPKAAPENIVVPRNAQVVTSTVPRVVFTTISSAVLLKGTTSVSVPVQAVVPGESGNFPADSLTNLATPLNGVRNVVDQSAPTTGGTNAESDRSLRRRWRRTVFHNLAGTEDMYLGLALEDTTPNNLSDTVAVQANVVGASRRWKEQVQVNGAGNAPSTIPITNWQHIFPTGAIFGEDIDSGKILAEGVHYTWNTTVTPPRIESIGGSLTTNRVYDLDFEYVSSASRNDPLGGITNRVDIWVSGDSDTPATETTYFRTNIFSASSAAEWYVGNFERFDTADVNPDAGNLFMPLAFGPVVTFPESLTIASTTYVKGTDYWVVHEKPPFGYAPTSRFGLEWKATSHPDTDTQIVLSGSTGYFYNRLPADVESRVRKWSLVTDDTRVHAAQKVYLRLSLAVMFDPNYSRVPVQTEIEQALAVYLSQLGFRSTIQVSDLLAMVHDIDGVDNVRFLNSVEPTATDQWGIERVTSSGTRISRYQSGSTPARAKDVLLTDAQVPVLQDVNVVVKAQNTFTEPDA